MTSRGLRVSAHGRSALLRYGSAGLAAATLAVGRAVPAPATSADDKGEIVATLVLDAPGEEEFLLHGTIPLAPGVVRLGAEETALSVVLPDGGGFALTQVEVVSRYPSDVDGADVVEVIARVKRPDGVGPGKRIHYPVVWTPQPRGVVQLHPGVQALLETDGALELRTQDVFENAYSADILGTLTDKTRTRRVRDGALVRERRIHTVMLPEKKKGGPQGTLPHLMGVHAYLRTLDAEPYFFLDLHVHNGLDGLDKTTPDDDALQEIYFRNLELRLPPGWVVIHAFEHPGIGGSNADGPWVDHRLLRSQNHRKHYVMPKQSHFVRRLAIAPLDDAGKARASLEERYLGFCRPGFKPNGEKLWSWWNRETARYFPQRQRLPQLDHVDLKELREVLASTLAYREQQVAEGSEGSYPFYSPRLGWAHPWGVPYGGMTGGDEINMFDGLRIATSGSRAGYRLSQLTMRAYMDRQPTALYDKTGRPTNVDDVLYTGPGGPYVTTTFFLVPKNGDPFGFEDAPTFHSEAARAGGLMPLWQTDLESYAPIDHQHYIRYTRNLKILTWLGNDSLAKAELEAAAENFHFSFHQWEYDKWNYVEGNSLLKRMNVVKEDPHEGLPIGRGEAWGFDVCAAAYSTAGPEFRRRTLPWLELIVRTIEGAQSTCTGNIQSLFVGKLLGGRYLVRRANESAYLENALRGINESAFRGDDDDQAWRIDQMIAKSVRAGMSAPYWSAAHEAPWSTVAVSGPSPEYPEFCHDVPSSGYEDKFSPEHAWSPLAYAWEITGDPFFLKRATELSNGQSLWVELHEDGLDGIEARAAMLALVQTLYDATR